MDLKLADLCKQLRLSGVYDYVQECRSSNPEQEGFLIAALQAELDRRRLNRQVRSLRQAGFPTKKRFDVNGGVKLSNCGRDKMPNMWAWDTQTM